MLIRGAHCRAGHRKSHLCNLHSRWFVLELVTFPTREDRIFNLISFSYFVILRVHLAWSGYDRAVVQIVPYEFQSSRTDVDPRTNWKAWRLQSRHTFLHRHSLGFLSAPGEPFLNVCQASSTYTCCLSTLIVTEEEEIQTETQRESWRPQRLNQPASCLKLLFSLT